MISCQTPHSICRFGLSRRDITPPVGIYHRMWGAALHDRSEGVHRPLSATAIVLEPAGGNQESSADARQVIVALDHCLLFHPQIVQITQRACERTAIRPEQLLITFSHTHAAGLMDPGRADLPGGDLIAPYLDRLANEVALAAQEALANLQPAVIVYGLGRCSLAAHRDFWDEANRQFVCGYNPDQPADDTLLVARVTAADGRPLATIVNYACHPTTLAWENKVISPDYPGAMCELVEGATAAPCVFLLGASGELGPRDGYVGDPAVADRNGRQLGYAALAALEALPPPATALVYQGPVISGATLGIWRHEPLGESQRAPLAQWQVKRGTIPLPYREGLPSLAETRRQLAHWTAAEQSARAAGDELQARDAHAMVERQSRWLTRLSSLPPGDTFPFPFTLLRIGGALWLGVEGEPYSLLQRALRERFPHTPLVVMVLSGGSRAWYLPTAETYGKGIYQESMANLAPGSLETLIAALGREIEAELLPPPPQPTE